MNEYPDVVAAITNDYLWRVKAQLRVLSPAEQNDFLREVDSHLHDAYDQTPGEDNVARILAVLRNFGEPADVVADRLPGAMARKGVKRNLPLYIIGGFFIALFGIPLGFGGFGVLLGLLAALAAMLIAYYALAGSLFLTGAVIMMLGAARVLAPDFWDSNIQIQAGPFGDFLQTLSPTDEGLLLVMFACFFLAAAWGLFRAGKHILRGLRFLFDLTFDWMRRFAKTIRQKLDRRAQNAPAAPKLSFVPNR
jgi:uncharacterized membrane protein